MRKHITLISLLSVLMLSFGQLRAADEGYEIKVKIDNYASDKLFLLNYYAKNTLFTDTTERNAKGEFVFEGKEALPGGMYVILLESKKNYFELLIDKDQHFEIITDSVNMIEKMQFKGSVDNIEFYQYLDFIGEQQKVLKELQTQKETADEKTKEKIDEQLQGLDKKVKAYQKKYIQDHPDRLFTAILKAGEEPEIPTVLPKKEDGTDDSAYVYTYYKQHFFDGFDFDDGRLVRTKVYAQKIERYYNQLMLKHPDSVIKEGDSIIQMAKGNYDTYKYTIWFFTYQTETSKVMGMDKAFVFFAKKYYMSGEADWVNDAVLKNMTERATTLERLLIGKPGPNMILIDTNNNWISMHGIPADYTILVFWDPDCGHCRTEMPLIRDWMHDEGEKYGAKVYAICSDTNLVKWRKEIHTKNYDFINVNGTRSVTPDYHDLYDIISTPVIYVLDRQKKILAKRIGYEQMADIIRRDYEEKQKAED